MTPKEAFPLTWPEHWPRTARERIQQSRFGTWAKPVTMAKACQLLYDELRRLGVSDIIVSSNVRVRLDGLPMSGQAQPNDKGIAVYFKFKGRQTVFACDKWHRVEDNLYAVAKHVEALRGQHRWGVGSIDQAFRGYQALPERSGGSAWWEVLGVAINASEEQITNAYRAKAKLAHPDTGGSHEKMTALNDAYRVACSQRNHHE